MGTVWGASAHAGQTCVQGHPMPFLLHRCSSNLIVLTLGRSHASLDDRYIYNFITTLESKPTSFDRSFMKKHEQLAGTRSSKSNHHRLSGCPHLQTRAVLVYIGRFDLTSRSPARRPLGNRLQPRFAQESGSALLPATVLSRR